METTTTTTKTCSKCGRELPLSEFYKKSNTKDGLQYCCKKCQNELAALTKKRKPQVNLTPPPSTAKSRVQGQVVTGTTGRFA